jgi:SH3-like domain-containing protein
MKKIMAFLTLAALFLIPAAAWPQKEAEKVRQAPRLSVKTPVANIRSGPGAEYDVLWRAEKYYPFVPIGESGNWHYFTDFENDRGWIYKPLADRAPSVIIKEKICDIRSGPGESHESLFKVRKGVPFKILEKKGEWIRVEHGDGDKGWVHESFVW